MKKYLLLAVLATGMLSFASAQKFGIEINFQNPFENTDFFSTNGLSVRYFVSDNVAIRGTLLIESTSDKSKQYDSEDEDKVTSTSKESNISFGLLPGFEYHFVQSDRISVFAGARVGFFLQNQSESTDYEESSYYDRSYKRSGFGFQAGAFTGVDYHLTSHLYIGAEIGLDYNFFSLGRGKTTIGSETTKGGNSYSSGSFGIKVTPSLRLGWTF